jgi:hypothetical protein
VKTLLQSSIAGVKKISNFITLRLFALAFIDDCAWGFFHHSKQK